MYFLKYFSMIYQLDNILYDLTCFKLQGVHVMILIIL